jgi:translation initiation factor 5A
MSNASHVIPAQASSVKKGGFVVLKGKPCKCVQTTTSKTGKHGHAKVHIVGTDIFTAKKYEDICPSTHNMEVPIVKRNEYQLLDIDDDGYCSLLTESGETKDDLQVPKDEVGEKLLAAYKEGSSLIVTVLGAMGHEQIMSFKEDSE